MKTEKEPFTIASPFHCTAEWHFCQMKSRVAPLIYSFGRKLSKTSGVFSASAENVAKYFGVNRKSVLRAIGELVDAGFFEAERVERFKPTMYRIIDHNLWAVRHPGQCLVKESFPWTGQGDPLGSQLYALSGGRVRFWPNQMTGLRNLGFPDDLLIGHFRNFMAQADYEGRDWKKAYYDFYLALKALTRGIESLRRDTMESLPRDTVGVPSVGHKSSKLILRSGFDDTRRLAANLPQPLLEDFNG